MKKFKKKLEHFFYSKKKRYCRALLKNDCEAVEGYLLENVGACEKDKNDFPDKVICNDSCTRPLLLVMRAYVDDQLKSPDNRPQGDRLDMILLLIQYGADVNGLGPISNGILGRGYFIADWRTFDGGKILHRPLTFLMTLLSLFDDLYVDQAVIQARRNDPEFDQHFPFGGPWSLEELNLRREVRESAQYDLCCKNIEFFMQKTALCLLAAGANPILHGLDISVKRALFDSGQNMLRAYHHKIKPKLEENGFTAHAFMRSILGNRFEFAALFLRYAQAHDIKLSGAGFFGRTEEDCQRYRDRCIEVFKLLKNRRRRHEDPRLSLVNEARQAEILPFFKQIYQKQDVQENAVTRFAQNPLFNKHLLSSIYKYL